MTIKTLVALVGTITFFMIAGCASSSSRRTNPDAIESVGVVQRSRFHALRLKPGNDLRKEIETYISRRGIRAGAIVTCVGSLRRACLHLADAAKTRTWEKKFEIVSLVGTVGDGGVHLHLSLADDTGATVGGHLVEGCIIYTTAEIVIVELEGQEFRREQDSATGYRELEIRKAP